MSPKAISQITMQAPSLLLLPHRSSAEIHMTDLSDQTLMEALIQETYDDFKQLFQYPSGRYLPVCRWLGVKCNGRRQVVEIVSEEFPYIDYQSILDISFLPPHIKSCHLPEGGDFFGKVETQALPSSLESLKISSNSFHSTFDFCRLPAKMGTLNISNNMLSGSCNLTNLPKYLVELDTSKNFFAGTIALDRLPRCLRVLSLASRTFRGKINLRSLPHGLYELNLTESDFFGEICLDYLPQQFGLINLSHNRLCGSIHAANIPQSIRILDLRGNEFTGVAVINVFMHRRVKYDSEYITSVANAGSYIYKQMPQDFDDLPHMMAFMNRIIGETKRMFQNRNGDPLPLKLWKGLEFNDLMRVARIQITEDTGFKNVMGQFDFDKLPRMVRAVEIGGYGKFVTGRIDTENLPKMLEEFKVPKNSMDEPFRFERLPMRIVTLDVSGNRFTGPVALNRLPIHMEILIASENRFGGNLDLTNLPGTLRLLRLRACLFKGANSFNLLPAGIEVLDLRENQIKGQFRMTRLPPSLRELCIDGNHFEGTAILSRDVPQGWSFTDSPYIEAVVDTNGVPYSGFKRKR